MEEGEWREAEETLRDLCLGMQVVGARWPSQFFIEIEAIPVEVDRPDLMLLVESRFAVYSERPDCFPDDVEALPELSLEEQVIALTGLAQQKIIDVRLGEQYSHLIVTFAPGKVLFVNGYDPHYESWTLQDVPQSDWMFVSTPGGGIAYSTPTEPSGQA